MLEKNALKLELLKLRNYKLKLEIFKSEKELAINHHFLLSPTQEDAPLYNYTPIDRPDTSFPLNVLEDEVMGL